MIQWWFAAVTIMSPPPLPSFLFGSYLFFAVLCCYYLQHNLRRFDPFRNLRWWITHVGLKSHRLILVNRKWAPQWHRTSERLWTLFWLDCEEYRLISLLAWIISKYIAKPERPDLILLRSCNFVSPSHYLVATIPLLLVTVCFFFFHKSYWTGQVLSHPTGR